MKTVFWGAVTAVLIGGFVWFSLNSLEPRAIRKIKLSEFDTPQAVANSVWLRLQEDFKLRPLWIVGVDPQNTDHLSSLTLFLQPGPDRGTHFDEIWIDESLGFEVSQATRSMAVKGFEESLRTELNAQIQSGRRVLLVTIPVYAASILEGAPAHTWIQGENSLDLGSVIFSEFPRSPKGEEGLKIPCALPGSDRFGTGALGCWIVQRARVNYRKKMTPGALVGLMDQISARDYLFLLGREPQP